MADIMMVVDTAVITPVNRLPLIDDTDFKTIEAAVAYNAAGMDLRWNFVTAAGVQTSTAVTPTTAGSYDWTHLGDGIYSMEIPASGGASANNDTEGFGWWSGVCTGVLPWAGPIIQFSPANIVNSMVTGSDILDVSVTQWLGTAAATPTVAGVPEVDTTHWNGTAVTTPPAVNATQISGDSTAADNAEAFFDGTGYAGTNNVIPTVTTLTNLPAITSNWLTAAGIAAGALDGKGNWNIGKTGYSLTATTGLGNQTADLTGSLSGSVGSVTAAVAITSNIKINQALAGFEFLMTDSTNHAPATGLTVTVTRSIDGGAFGAGTLSAVSEIGNGIYSVNFGAGDLNGKVITLQATAAASDTTFERIVTQA